MFVTKFLPVDFKDTLYNSVLGGFSFFRIPTFLLTKYPMEGIGS